MKIGRNDPCPCGSGKKYKKCCLEKDQAAERARPAIPIQLPAAGFEMASSSLLEPPPARPPDPRADAIYARWEEFQEQDYEGQIALFTRSLDEDLIDEESAFEMLNTIYYDSVERGERDRFDALARDLRERLRRCTTTTPHFIWAGRSPTRSWPGKSMRFRHWLSRWLRPPVSISISSWM